MPDPHGHGQYRGHRLDLPAFASGKTTLGVMSATFTIFGLSLLLQGHRWASTPAYHDLLHLLSAWTWGWLFLASGLSMGAACWQFRRRWLVIAALTLAFMLTSSWMLAFAIRYLTSPNVTPETWVSWGIFGYLLIRVAMSIDSASPPGPLASAEAREATRAPPGA